MPALEAMQLQAHVDLRGGSQWARGVVQIALDERSFALWSPGDYRKAIARAEISSRGFARAERMQRLFWKGWRCCRFASAAGLHAEKSSNRWSILRWAAETLAEREGRGLAA